MYLKSEREINKHFTSHPVMDELYHLETRREKNMVGIL